MFELPYFTDKDQELARSGSTRDALGTQAIWTTIGRQLVPCLAGAVNRVEGLLAVMLIHHLIDGPLKSLATKNFRGLFRLLEGVIEFHLYKHYENSVCFGKRSLAAGNEKFEVSPQDTRTVANGLYQYYRGTCRRAGLLQPDWQLNAEWSQEFKKICDHYPEDLSKLSITLEGSLSDKAAIMPAKLLVSTPGIVKLLDRVLASSKLLWLLDSVILGETEHQNFANWCSDYLDYDFNERMTRLGERIPLEWPLREAYSEVMHSFRFLSLLDSLFELLQTAPRRTLTEISGDILSSQAKTSITHEAERFLRLKPKHNNERFGTFYKLADAALYNASLHPLLQQLVEHHTALANVRGQAALMILESDSIIVPTPLETPPSVLVEQIAQPKSWRYDYYTGVAGIIYHQLSQKKSQRNG